MSRIGRGKWMFTSESVTPGHPDKICDQISDTVLDAVIAEDPDARVACETLVTTGMVLVAGEISTSSYVDIPTLVRDKIDAIGYNRAKFGFDSHSCAVLTTINEQSADIALGVDRSYESKAGKEEDSFELGAGDQGMVFGYACSDTPELMPLPIMLAHSLCRKLTEVRQEKLLPYLRPDGKSQVTVEYFDDKPIRVDAVVVSGQHSPDIDIEDLRADILEKVIKPVIPEDLFDDKTKVFINPTGKFVIGGPQGDCGLTGRKIIVDSYGGFAGHGGGAYSGKDPTKVDRSASYAARHVAKNIVAAGLADECEVQVSYGIGIAEPISLYVDSFGTGKLKDSEITDIVAEHFDLKPSAIISKFDLRRPIYSQLAAFGHFGRSDLDLPWEKTDMAETLKKYLPRD